MLVMGFHNKYQFLCNTLLSLNIHKNTNHNHTNKEFKTVNTEFTIYYQLNNLTITIQLANITNSKFTQFFVKCNYL